MLIPIHYRTYIQKVLLPLLDLFNHQCSQLTITTNFMTKFKKSSGVSFCEKRLLGKVRPTRQRCSDLRQDSRAFSVFMI